MEEASLNLDFAIKGMSHSIVNGLLKVAQDLLEITDPLPRGVIEILKETDLGSLLLGGQETKHHGYPGLSKVAHRDESLPPESAKI